LCGGGNVQRYKFSAPDPARAREKQMLRHQIFGPSYFQLLQKEKLVGGM
jgi:hypothetical protein